MGLDLLVSNAVRPLLLRFGVVAGSVPEIQVPCACTMRENYIIV